MSTADDYPRLTRAIFFASMAHGTRSDKNGQPFIGHPLRVMAKLTGTVSTVGPDGLIAAVLHDVVEDEDVTLFMIERDFGYPVRRLVDSLSRRTGEKYFDYIKRCAADPVAAFIKQADIDDNLDPRRRAPDTESLRTRYLSALAILRGEFDA